MGWAWATRSTEGGREETQKKDEKQCGKKDRTTNINQNNNIKEKARHKRSLKESQAGKGGEKGGHLCGFGGDSQVFKSLSCRAVQSQKRCFYLPKIQF